VTAPQLLAAGWVVGVSALGGDSRDCAGSYNAKRQEHFRSRSTRDGTMAELLIAWL
jgi:hypothetical protein